MISSPVFRDNGPIPREYGYEERNVNPPLEIDDVTSSAESLALIVDAPDAPIPNPPWVHWTVWNIDPQTREIGEGSVPGGAVEGTTSFGSTGYGGPAPPSGTHHYHFKVFALDTKLNLPEGSKADELHEAMEGHIIDRAEIVGLYSK